MLSTRRVRPLMLALTLILLFTAACSPALPPVIRGPEVAAETPAAEPAATQPPAQPPRPKPLQRSSWRLLRRRW